MSPETDGCRSCALLAVPIIGIRHDNYCQTYNIRPIKPQNSNVSRLILLLSFPNPLLSQVWRCSWSSADRRCPNYIWVIHWSPVDSPHKGQWNRALMFSLICAWAIETPVVWDPIALCSFWRIIMCSGHHNYLKCSQWLQSSQRDQLFVSICNIKWWYMKHDHHKQYHKCMTKRIISKMK